MHTDDRHTHLHPAHAHRSCAKTTTESIAPAYGPKRLPGDKSFRDCARSLASFVSLVHVRVRTQVQRVHDICRCRGCLLAVTHTHTHTGRTNSGIYSCQCDCVCSPNLGIIMKSVYIYAVCGCRCVLYMCEKMRGDLRSRKCDCECLGRIECSECLNGSARLCVFVRVSRVPPPASAE